MTDHKTFITAATWEDATPWRAGDHRADGPLFSRRVDLAAYADEVAAGRLALHVAARLRARDQAELRWLVSYAAGRGSPLGFETADFVVTDRWGDRETRFGSPPPAARFAVLSLLPQTSWVSASCFTPLRELLSGWVHVESVTVTVCVARASAAIDALRRGHGGVR